MSDQPPLKSSAPEASKSFAIPTRPSMAGTREPKAPSLPAPHEEQPEHKKPLQTNVAQPQSPAEPPYDAEALTTGARRTQASEQSLAPTQQAVPPVSQTRPTETAPALSEEARPLSEPRLPGPSSASLAPPPAAREEYTPDSSRARTAPGAVAQLETPASTQTFTFEDKWSTAPTFILPVAKPLPAPSSPRTLANQWSRQAPQAEGSAPLPLAPHTPIKSKNGRRRFLPVALVIAALVLVLGGVFAQQLLSNINANNAQNSAQIYSGDGSYVRLPLTPQQIYAIQHLAGHMKYKALASLYVSQMSLDDEIGQLIMVEYNQPSYSSDIDYMINTLHVGGVIMYEFQMTSASQTKADIAHMQQRANIPLLISTDEEGGPYVHRLSNIYGYRMSATQIEQSGSLDVAKQQGLKTSRDLAALGINEDLAPDIDVNQVNGYDMVTRTFGNTPNEVVKYAGAYLQAMQGNGTVACIKHYPGLGGALTDAHKGLPVVHSTQQQIYDIDLAPFKAFIQSPNALLNPGMIMPTDVLLPAIDPKYPAELSPIFMTDILRKQFGYDGVTLTDALYMQGITDTWDMYTASVMALQAGNDMLLGANGTDQTIGVINAIKHALQTGQLTKARIDESVARILALKMQYHLMPTYIPED